MTNRPKNLDVCLKAALDRRLSKFPFKLKQTMRGFDLTDEQRELYDEGICLIIDDILKRFTITANVTGGNQ